MFLHKKIHPNEQVKLVPYGGFLKWWYSTTIGFPTKNDRFGVFWGYHHLRKHPYHSVDKFLEVAHFARKFLEMPISFGSRSSSPPKIGSALKQGEKSTSIQGVKLCFFFGGGPWLRDMWKDDCTKNTPNLGWILALQVNWSLVQHSSSYFSHPKNPGNIRHWRSCWSGIPSVHEIRPSSGCHNSPL